jgi:hypothetical protein
MEFKGKNPLEYVKEPFKVQAETGIADDWINEFAAFYSGIFDDLIFPAVDTMVKNGERLKTYEERYHNVPVEGGVITDKNREAIKELDTLVKECNTLLDEWAATGSVSEDQKLYVWNLWNKMGKIVMGSKFKVYRPEKRS